ncbi:MAG: hypothetical protein J1E97_02220 [Muribaculaceae bacterium]|nr:hypothetical protein [Muribaculaceae bacterium]
MKGIRFIFLGAALVALLWSCEPRRYETCSQDRIVGDWAVVNTTHDFGEFDSTYYLINPIADVLDTIYFNGNYTDSYYSEDSTRVTLRYTADDSIQFCIQRRYAVEVNPKHLLMTIRAEGKDTCELRMLRDNANWNVFKCGPDSAFNRLLRSSERIQCTATNTTSSWESAGSQHYEFELFTAGFERALAMADSLNRVKHPKDTIEKEKTFLNIKL